MQNPAVPGVTTRAHCKHLTLKPQCNVNAAILILVFASKCCVLVLVHWSSVFYTIFDQHEILLFGCWPTVLDVEGGHWYVPQPH